MCTGTRWGREYRREGVAGRVWKEYTSIIEHTRIKPIKFRKVKTAMNDTLKTIAQRYSCRAYTRETPTDAELRAIADAALQSPSAMNRQDWQIIVVKNKSLLEDIEAEGMRVLEGMQDKSAYNRIQSRGGKVYYNAPVMFVVAVDQNRDLLNCGIVCQNIALAAAAQGLGSVICGMVALAFSPEKKKEFEKRMGFPSGYSLGMAVLVGKAGDGPKTPHAPDRSKISFVE